MGFLDGTTMNLGVGLIALVLVLRLIFDFLLPILKGPNGQRNGQRAGDQSVVFWQEEQRRTLTQSLDASILPILNRQLEILTELRAVNNIEHERLLQVQHSCDDIVKVLATISHDIEHDKS